MQKNSIAIKFASLIILVCSLGLASKHIGFSGLQALAVSVLATSILGTIFFWDFRLAFAFVGTSALLIFKAIDIETLVLSASLEVILFLVGMMVLIGLLKEAGVFAWIITLILRVRNLNARRFTIIIAFVSALLACAVDEVTSIVFMVAAILEICDYFEVTPIPFITISVLSTNIGSSGTVLGNPIGILIASKAGLTFEDFIARAFPIMLLSLCASTAIIFVIFRKDIRNLNGRIKEFGANEMLIRLISVPPDQHLKNALGVFGVTLVCIAFHHRLEQLFGLEANTILLTVPLIFAGIVMAWRHTKARKYIEHDVEWWTLLFFMLLFIQTGTLKYTGATDVIAHHIANFAGHNQHYLIGLILWISTFGSSILDNVVLVAAFIPIIQSFQTVPLEPLWWALLFGGCLGGNITLIGSTANIVALGILEKERALKVSFLHWLWIGAIVGITTVGIVWVCLLLMYPA